MEHNPEAPRSIISTTVIQDQFSIAIARRIEFFRGFSEYSDYTIVADRLVQPSQFCNDLLLRRAIDQPVRAGRTAPNTTAYNAEGDRPTNY
jgi:hypothetical protein